MLLLLLPGQAKSASEKKRERERVIIVVSHTLIVVPVASRVSSVMSLTLLSFRKWQLFRLWRTVVTTSIIIIITTITITTITITITITIIIIIIIDSLARTRAASTPPQ